VPRFAASTLAAWSADVWQPPGKGIPHKPAKLYVRLAPSASDHPALGAANRDPARSDHADQFDIGRKKLPHLRFAFGLHSCLGMNLACLEAQIFLEELLAALPD
jgi:hypothetical protein